ncbi:MAG TPA: ATP-binding cassette domain-containing protein [Nitrospirota bacterium]|nr:ATP-binding cassette domain-containing protein [Nitrospirota bacterium]
MSIINVQNLAKQFKSVRAVDGISFSVSEGEVFGFLGPNGAGKTTTINILCTLLSATSGKAEIAGYDCAKDPDEVRTAIGLIFQDTTLDTGLTAYENLKFHAYLYNLDRKLTERRIDDMLAVVELQNRKHDLIKNFSGGMKRRLEIARGLLHYPRVLFLDEPTLGLDPQTRNTIWDFINTLRKKEKITVFMTTHYMEEAENCDRIAIMDHGKIIALDTPALLKEMVHGDIIHLVTADNQKASREVQKTFGITAQTENGGLSLEAERGDEFIPKLIHSLSVETLSVGLKKPTLNDVFLRLTGRTIRDEMLQNDREITREFVRSHRRAQR